MTHGFPGASYDAWKTRSPDDEYQEECFHEDYEADVNGRATCCRCGERWWLSEEEIRRERELHVAYDKMMRREEWRQRWEQWTWRPRCLWRRLTAPFRRKPEPINDDCPF